MITSEGRGSFLDLRERGGHDLIRAGRVVVHALGGDLCVVVDADEPEHRAQVLARGILGVEHSAGGLPGGG